MHACIGATKKVWSRPPIFHDVAQIFSIEYVVQTRQRYEVSGAGSVVGFLRMIHDTLGTGAAS